jgi:polysaccharide pyruvyl transferase WcaK-like protein/coenzyme F420-reducing hydrogenase beta subunit
VGNIVLIEGTVNYKEGETPKFLCQTIKPACNYTSGNNHHPFPARNSVFGETSVEAGMIEGDEPVLPKTANRKGSRLYIRVESGYGEKNYNRMMNLLQFFSGGTQVVICENGRKPMYLERKYWVNKDDCLLNELKDKYTLIDLGHIEDDKMITAYNACDIFLMPSRGESFGLMAIEAMACSRPIIIFDNSDLPSVTFAPDCGFLVENRNAHKLMEAIKYLIENEDERNRRGNLGRKLAVENYDINVYNEKMLKLYEQIYKRHKSEKGDKNIVLNIDYSLVDVQALIKKLREILINIFKTDELPIEFLNHQQKYIGNHDYKIDYSLTDVQLVIKQFNDYMYDTIKSENIITTENYEFDFKNLSIVKKFFYLWENDRQKLKETIKHRLKKHQNIYKLLKAIYGFLRKVKNILVNQKHRNVVNDINNIRIQFDRLSSNNQQLFDDFKSISDKNIELIEDIKKLNSKIELMNLDGFFDQKNIFYYHGGSGNHGCEALVRTLININDFKRSETSLYSYVPEDDYKYRINEIVKYIYPSNLDATEIDNNKLSNNAIALSIGGDNYCGYDSGTNRLAKYNKKFNEIGIKTALIGCSIEPEILEHQEVLDDLNRFSLITARETITYEALLKKGIKRNTHLIPDSAFTLEKRELPLPDGFEINNTIGINLSSLVQLYDNDNDLTFNNYKKLIEYIINSTNYQIALIPHVIQSFNDDLSTLKKLHSIYKDTGRVILIDECNCNELKGYISRCKIFVGARTHSTIAAYSSEVPTLVLGYSVKSRGIAKDIFGTEENYVLPVQSLKNDDELTNAFIWINNNYEKIKKHLTSFMPKYIERCYDLKPLIQKLKETGTIRTALADKKTCSGCGACAAVCPSKCIKMEESKEGFLYPNVDYTKCTDCGLCRKVCIVNQKIESKSFKTAYAAMNKNDEIRLNSSSGGVFDLLAKYTLNNKGVVIGAAFNEHNEVCHIIIDKIKDLNKLYGSKYVQSNLKNTYIETKKYLEEGKEVLFSGTPCQIFGLKSFLSKKYDNLLTVDFVCHGVPSPKIFKKYCEFLEKENNSKITEINFRNKSKGWKLSSSKYVFANGKTLVENSNENIYMKAFLNNLSLRESCYNCKIKKLVSGSDITLADYWGVEKVHEKLDDNKGTSLVIINSPKGGLVFDEINCELNFLETNFDVAASYNRCVNESVSPHPNRSQFFENIDNNNIVDLINNNLD